ncbi:hypothetical protein [Mycobacteroides chelonae]|uniref:hypothetical protein n=1 Tax=Mycobacteroides chelonae TaxID=1774 RepID=UPI000991A1B9|nr:hypothetical protein [Mycobacteroides chelonae]
MSSKQFTFNGAGRVFTAHHFTEPLNGALVPVVDRETLAELAAERPAELVWNGDVALVDGEELYPYPRGADRYALELDWDFHQVFPTGAPTLRFEIDGYPADDGEEFFAYAFDAPWNGFDQPVVDRETLVTVVATAGDTAILSWGGDTAVINGDGYLVELPPDDAGRYHLRYLGWCFTAVEESQ